MAKERIIIGSDHAGFELKDAIARYLAGRGFAVTNVGTESAASVDYPDFGAEVARRVSAGEFARGILVCGSGVGMAIVAGLAFGGVRITLKRLFPDRFFDRSKEVEIIELNLR